MSRDSSPRGGQWLARGEDAAADAVGRPDRHLCHAIGCAIVVPPAMLMCGRHWAMAPRALRDAVWRLYRPGQEISKTPSAAYLAAARAAIDAVAAREGQQTELRL